MRTRSITPTSYWAYSWIPSWRSPTPCVPVNSLLSLGYNPPLPLGATTNAHRCGEVVPAEAGNVAGPGAKGIEHGNQGLRFPGCSRSSVYLLEVAVNGPRRSKGGDPHKCAHLRSDGHVGRDFGSPAANIHSKNEHFPGTFG